MMSPYEDIVTFIANQMKCPICFDMFTEPVSLVCGHSYCLRCIQGHINRSRSCPQCRAELRPDCKLHKNVTICAILDLQEVGGREMWDRVLTGSEERVTQDALERKLDFLQQEIKKIEILQASLQNGSCFIRDDLKSYESSSLVDMLTSSLQCEGESQCPENTSRLQLETRIQQVVKTSESGSKKNVSDDPDSLIGCSEGGSSAAAAVSAAFIPLSFLPEMGHRHLVFHPQRLSIEVRSCSSLRMQSFRFEKCQWMAEQEFITGRCYWDIETSACSGWAAGVAYPHLGHDERIGRSNSSWCIEWRSGRFSAWHDGSETLLNQRHPNRIRVLLDMDAERLSFWSGADGNTELYNIQVQFRAPVRPVFWLFGTRPGNTLSFPRP